jgi:LytS/YehU family sensor histidine kinase
LLRRLLNAGERDFSRLTDELQFVSLYLELQQRRFTERLTIHLPGAEDLPVVWVPSLILQPLVENAVVHGMAGHQGPVDIHLSVQISGNILTLRLVNSIAPLKTIGEEGIGLNNVRERLSVQFGQHAGISTAIDGAEWAVQITMPVLLDIPQTREVSRIASLG